MNATIKSIHIENFKGIKDKTFDLANLSRLIEGRNAEGKTTLADAYMWLFSDKDMSLRSNPDIKPLGVSECIPTVSVVLTVDDKDIEFVKAQKIKCSEPDENGVRKVSASNSYMINSVPKNERDFKAYLDEIGFPKDNDFLIMSHTNVFTSMKSADMRNILFSMVSEVTDLEVAEKTEGASDLKALLENYKLEEIEAMQKSSKKNAEDQLKNIPGQIEGLELAKTEDIDTSEQELLVKSLQEQIATERANADKIREEDKKIETLKSKKIQIEFDLNMESQNMNAKANEGLNELRRQADDCHNKLVDAKRHVAHVTDKISNFDSQLKFYTEQFEKFKGDYEDAKSLTFNDKSTICPLCGRTYEPDRVEEIKASFEKEKKQKMDEINHKAKEVQENMKSIQLSIDGHNDELAKANKQLANFEKHEKEFTELIDGYEPNEVEESELYKQLKAQLEATNKEISELESHGNDLRLRSIQHTIYDLESQLAEANKVIGQSSNNVRIDEQIAELENKRDELEQAKADCEKILYQLDLFSKKRNELLTDEINKHFKKVKWELFTYLKNGNYKECCNILSLDDKPLGVATNTALEVEMKMDICQAFQRFYDQSIPLWIDGAECFSSDSYNRLECETQHIYLKVSDCDLTLR